MLGEIINKSSGLATMVEKNINIEVGKDGKVILHQNKNTFIIHPPTINPSATPNIVSKKNHQI